MRKTISLVLVICVLFSTLGISVLAAGISITNAVVNNGVLEVTLSGSINGTAEIEVAGFVETRNISGSSFTYGLPVRSVPYGEHTITVRCRNSDGDLLDTIIITASFGMEDGDLQTPADTNPLHKSRAIMQPYAKVYGDPGMGVKIADLKKYDYVQVLSDDGTIAKVSYRIQSGNGTTSRIDSTHGIYSSSDDLRGVGYIYSKAFEAPSLQAGEGDKQRDVVELAYSRLGTQGVYNQGLRLTDCYLDCAALASYCWYQVGYDFSDGGNTACSGIVTWAKNNHAVLWEAETQPDLAGVMAIQGETEEGEADDDFDPTFDSDVHEYNCDEFIIFTRVFDPADFLALQPGDLIFFTYRVPVQSTSRLIINTRIRDVYNHVAVFVGCKTNSYGEVVSVQCIESSNPDKNTHITTYAPSELTADLSMIVRPIGCEQMDSGITYIVPIDPEGWVFPVPSGYVVTSPYGPRVHPITGRDSFHNGVDLAIEQGTPIYAAYDGVVTTAITEDYGGYGKYVIITHGDGYSTLYGHMSECAVEHGGAVKAGDVIGYVGSTGSSTGPHLHFTVMINGGSINPASIFAVLRE